MYIEEKSQQELAKLADDALVEQVHAGNHRAFEALVWRYYTALYNFTSHCLGDYEQARDVTQFVFLQLYISIPRLHNNLHSARSKAPLKSWLFQVAWNRCMDEKRRKRPLLFCELDAAEEDEDISLINTIPDPAPEPDEVAEQNDLQGHLHCAIQQLPLRFRRVVFLRYTEELSFGEIGHRLNMPENTAKTYFQRARPLLRAALKSRHSAVAS
ncbi:MAG: sigma-70 family RNA polymerase sigma factor [Ktedonobacteraceae bacterium]|nr:sigma-70 family RNA polymerase sigma factor [Ktedonobacteraceae bacterium]